MLTFREETHTYFWNDKVVPGITSLLAWACQFGFITPEQMEAARDRGTYTHSMCELSDLNVLDDDAERDGEHWPRLVAWRNWCLGYGANWEAIEQMGYSQRYGYAGRPDRRGMLAKFGTHRWIVEIKTSDKPSDVWGLQLAAQKQLAIEEDADWAGAHRATVQLTSDGRAIFREWKDPFDWAAWAAIITLYHWKQQHRG